NIELRIVTAAVKANERQIASVSEKIKSALNDVKGKTIAILGLSFKPNTDDIREAPAISIIQSLLDAGANIKAYDPVAMDNAKVILPQIIYCNDAYEACEGADAAVIVTEWNQFRNLEPAKLMKMLKQPYFFDLRNIYDPQKMKEAGFKYYSVGRSL
ncbi:MAG: UDP-glucose/GDP-mannose dehydrogenase family protein, partial [Nitrospirae bacterium]|nr:UDP-glucose/GDP-mannose dehydrogenase family protein [Nitrospirota bacterium]